MSEQKQISVAVIGSGLVGTVLTLALLNRGIKVQLYERGTQFSEYGAGLGISSVAAQALQICGPELEAALKKVITVPQNKKITFELKDGYNQPSRGGWTIPWDGVSGGVHRAQLLDVLAKQLPDGVTHFSKNLQTIEEPADAQEPLKLNFADGTSATADVLVGCDGVGSRVRRHLLGDDHPAARARYAHRYVYRALLPIEDAIKAVGEERVRINTLWMGHGAQCVTAAIAGSTLYSMTMSRDDAALWPSTHSTVMPARKEDVLADFADWGPEMRALAAAIKPPVDRWALFDLAENPAPFCARGRVALAGDAAHASTPHLGSGAAFGMEDAAVLAELLADPRVVGTGAGPRALHAALQAYSEVRVPRGQWLSKASRDTGNALVMKDPYAGDDIEKIQQVVMANFHMAWNRTPESFVREAKEVLSKRLAESQGSD